MKNINPREEYEQITLDFGDDPSLCQSQGEINEYDDGDNKFIWGVKSTDDLSMTPACLYTMNDIDIVYSREKKRYVLGIETAYWFVDKLGEVKYLSSLLEAFTRYMNGHGLSTNDTYKFWMSQPSKLFEGETIPELYTNFRIFVEGYKTLYANERITKHETEL